MKTARQIVAETLLSQERRGAWSNLALDHALERNALSSADAAFAGALFYGVIERRLTLDACIAAHSKQPPDKLDSAVRTALRLGVYQLLYMEGVPESAAVNESVELVRGLRKASAAGYVNGVLRAFLRAGKAVPLPQEPLAARLSVEYSCPAPLVALWLDTYGEEPTRRFLAGSVGPSPIAVRVNTLKTAPDALIAALEEEGVAATAHPDLPDCLLLEHSGAVQKLKSFQQGLFHVQDPASQLCALAVDAKPDLRVLDACAAPGGKSFTLAQMMQNTGELVACDLHQKRVDLISKRAQQMSLPVIRAQALDMSEPHPDLGAFDRVLVDAPCSGYGVIRHKPEIKYKPLEEFTDIPNIQYKILEISADYCKVGGRLIYSTCTLNPAENDGVADRFLREHPAFVPAPLGGILGEAPRRTLLGEYLADGFFLAAFTRGASA